MDTFEMFESERSYTEYEDMFWSIGDDEKFIANDEKIDEKASIGWLQRLGL